MVSSGRSAGLLVAAACVLWAAVDVHAQSAVGVCDRTLGEADWPCIDIAPVPAQVSGGNSNRSHFICSSSSLSLVVAAWSIDAMQ